MRFIVTAEEEGMLNVQLERLLAVGGLFFALSYWYQPYWLACKNTSGVSKFPNGMGYSECVWQC